MVAVALDAQREIVAGYSLILSQATQSLLADVFHSIIVQFVLLVYSL